MKLKALVSKKVATIALAGTIGLGAVGGATYAAAPGLIDKILSNYFYYTDRDLNNHRAELANNIPAKISSAIDKANSTFSAYYAGKRDEAKKKMTEDVDKYVQEKSTITDEERAGAEKQIDERIDKKREEYTAQLKAQIDNEFKK